MSHDICSFCAEPEIYERQIARNELAWAFLTRTPIVPGHVLVCPIRCVPSLDDLSEDETSALLELRSYVKQALAHAFSAAGFNYAWNEGVAAGQTVSHVHLHILPRKQGDVGVYGYEPRSFLYRPGSREVTPKAELAAIARDLNILLLRSGLGMPQSKTSQPERLQ